jgi:hypothetical protein
LFARAHGPRVWRRPRAARDEDAPMKVDQSWLHRAELVMAALAALVIVIAYVMSR